jgi:AcrR family transcriptional regulator
MKPRTKKTRGKRLENKEKTRKAILRAALQLFAEKGFYQTTTKAIARKAGIAEGTLFNYFETKED